MRLRDLCGQTPERDARYEAKTLTIVTKLIMVKPGMKTSELAAEAKGDAYQAALDDLPWWAVEAAVRGWYRGAYGSNYDYHWAPEQDELRSLAYSEMWKVEGRARELESLLAVVPLDPTAEPHKAAMRKKLREALPWLRVDGEPAAGGQAPFKQVAAE
ncbi:MAG: hypothetical protein Q7R45_07225 [Sulfuricaulis sp.]|nr:hypothetical protein [Sulfuricaulis sp.]